MSVIVGLPVGPAQSADGGQPPIIGSLERFPADAVKALGDRIKPTSEFDERGYYGGTLVAMPHLRQLWQVHPTASDATGPTAIAVRNFDSLALTTSFELPVSLYRGAKSDYGGDWMHAVSDERAFFLAKNRADGAAAWSVAEVDLRTFAQKNHAIKEPFVVANRSTFGFLPAAIEYDPFDDALLILFGGVPATSGGNATTIVYRLDLKTGTSQTRQIRACNGPLTPTDSGVSSQLAAVITRESVYFSCQRAGSIGAVARLSRPGIITDSTEDIVAGPAYLETAFADPDSGRLFLITVAGEIWAFDTRTMSFVGVVAAGAEGEIFARLGYGIDTLTGRLFFQSRISGLGIAEGRFYPIPQARSFSDRSADGQERIISDGKNGRLFVLTGYQTTRVPAYTIYDIGQAPAPPPPADPDRSTLDIPEQQGVTEPRYFSSATGYGVRLLLAKGISAVPPAPAAGQIAPSADIISKNVNSQCGFTDRELVAGRVSKAEYETGSTSARAIGIDVDERTKLDLTNLSRCDVTVRSSSEVFSGIFSTGPKPVQDQTRNLDGGPGWDNEAADCSSSEGEPGQEAASKNETPSAGTVSCPTPGDKLTADAVGYLNGAVTVGKATTSSVISRTDGVTATVVAEAQDINIAGVLFIGEVTSVATSRSNGRPGRRPMSDHSVTVRGVRNGTSWICKDVCDLEVLTRTLNLLMGGRVEFRTTNGLDEGLRAGTPKGALTAVQKSSARQSSDQALVGDSTTEVAGLEMVVYNDNKPFGRARQIYQFAGVATAATYNIQKLPFGDGFGDDPDGDGFDESDLSAAGAEGDAFMPDGGGLQTTPAVSKGDEGGPIARFLRALGRGIRMFFTDPRQALLLLTGWALFALPPVLSRRRRLLAAARST
ncbi:MAG TPA: hypothetical protein VM938_04675 [Acidimicrobiales bacterium]|nr:hypothetical protein [Acidimicrobiales bacterium]